MRLTHVRLLVADFGACFRFYRDVVGLEPTFGDEDGGYADFRAGEAQLALFDREGMSGVTGLRPGGEGAVLVFGVDDVDVEAERLRSLDVTLESQPHDQPDWGIRVAHFCDPDGNLVEIYQPVDS